MGSSRFSSKFYPCNTCLQSFSSKRRGMSDNVDLGIKPHGCHHKNCNKSYHNTQSLVRHRHTHKGEGQYRCCRDGCADKFCAATSDNQCDLSANDKDKTPRDPTQAAMSGLDSAIATGLSTPDGDGFFSDVDQIGSPDSQQYAMAQHSQLIQRNSSAARHGNTTVNTNFQSSTIEAAVFNHGMVTPGQSPVSCDGFIGRHIASKPMFSATWNTYSDFAPNTADVSRPFPTHSIWAVGDGQQFLQPAPAPHAFSQAEPPLPSLPLPPPQSPPRPPQTQFYGRRLFKHNLSVPKFPRPPDGKANGYIKFFWPRKKGRQSSRIVEAVSIGHNVWMDKMGRELCKFYIRNWCPGRSLLTKTNPWRLFADTQRTPSVVAAMQSLAGIYVHDSAPCEAVRLRVCEGFAFAEDRLSKLLHNIHKLSAPQSSELVTLISLLCVQDVVVTEHWLPKPQTPRWLMGFRRAEEVLQLTESNVQVSALHVSQSVIVARAVILAQLMMPLPVATFDFSAETTRFNFLLPKSEADMLEVHGGCGFSRRLLHIFSQVSSLSTRMLQDSETPVVPGTAELLYEQLVQMHQWSSECESWTPSKSSHQPIEWIRRTDNSYVAQEAKQMIEVTAEAWRLAGMVYLQCRLLRLPRNNHMVIDNIADLAKCISMMPTSGTMFTANAPLLPVFFLGLLATVKEHVVVANAWFEQVLKTRVRSSVPPLHRALDRIQSWMDREVPVPAPDVKPPRTIAERKPWWESMVAKVQEMEKEVLCVM